MDKNILYTDEGAIEDDFAFALEDLDITTDFSIVAIADIGRWNGRSRGYRLLGNNVKEILKVYEDFNEYYSDGKDIRAELSHHDGTHYILFRELKDITPRQTYNFLQKLTSDKELTKQQLERYTSSLIKYIGG